VTKHSKFPQNKPNATSFSPTLLSRWLYPNQLRTHWLIQGTRRLFRRLCFLVDFIATNLELIDLSRERDVFFAYFAFSLTLSQPT